MQSWKWLLWMLPFLLGGYFLFQPTSPSHPAPDLPQNQQTLLNFQHFTLSGQGEITAELRGESWVTLDEQHSQILQPEYITHQADKTTRITAQTADLNHKEKTLLLTGKVMLTESNASHPLSFTTENLLYNQQTQMATGSAAVQIQSAQGEIQGIGLQAWLNEGRYQLNSDVKGHYLAH